VIGDLLASGQVARMNAGWRVTRPPGWRPTRQRFSGTVCQAGEAVYLALFPNDRCLSSFPSRHDSRHDKAFTTYDAVRSSPALAHEGTTRKA
jgi:hypothetical protein